ncbi:MAG: hypothetical protein AB1540_11315 [Bdellovibrionota bacterium]
MAQKIDFKRTKETFDKLLSQAKESVKVLETLQKEGVARAKSYVTISMPSRDEAQRVANEKIIATLNKLGLATRTEVRDLEKRVEELASELRGQISKVSRKQKSAKSEREADTTS